MHCPGMSKENVIEIGCFFVVKRKIRQNRKQTKISPNVSKQKFVGERNIDKKPK